MSNTTNSTSPLKNLFNFLWPHKWRLISASCALIFTAFAQLAVGFGIKILIDEGFSGTDSSGLYQAMLIYELYNQKTLMQVEHCS